MFRCVLKPLKGQIDGTLQTLHERDSSTQSMAESLAKARGKTPLECFGVRVRVPDAADVEKVRQKVALMRRAYSPIDKVVLLLQVCKLIYKAMKDNSGEGFSLSECDREINITEPTAAIPTIVGLVMSCVNMVALSCLHEQARSSVQMTSC